MEGLLTRQGADVAGRLRKHGLSGRTVTIKVRLHDFTTLNRSIDAELPHRQRHDRGQAGPGAARRPGHLRWRAAARRRRLGARRLDPGRPVRRDRAGGRPATCPRSRRRPSVVRPGHRAWTSSTTRWAAAGCGDPVGASSPSGSRPPRPSPAPFAPTRPTTPRCGHGSPKFSRPRQPPGPSVLVRGHPPSRPDRRRPAHGGVQGPVPRRRARPGGRAALDPRQLLRLRPFPRQRGAPGGPGRVRRWRAGRLRRARAVPARQHRQGLGRGAGRPRPPQAWLRPRDARASRRDRHRRRSDRAAVRGQGPRLPRWRRIPTRCS